MAGYSKSDFWAQKAQREGYAARSVYKLQEIDGKFHILPASGIVLDLGASPGSWTSYVLRNTQCSIVSCDLNPLADNIDNIKDNRLTFIQGDISSKEVREAILRLAYDAVICDAAPLTTGNKTVDTARSEQLVEMAVWYAEHALKEGGGFAVKIFQNGSQRQFLDHMRRIFTSARAFKPQACRSQSVETYLVGTKKRAL